MKKILIVDDDKDLLYGLSAFLSKKNFQILAFRQGVEALEKAPGFSPDLILLDKDLEDMDERKVCGELRRDPRTCQVPVMMMSAEINEALIRKTCAAEDFIEKPFSLSSLFSKIEALTA